MPKSKAKANETAQLKSAKDLKSFLQDVKQQLESEEIAPVYALTALNHVMTLENVYDLLDNPNKKLAREIWTSLKAAGLQLENPPILSA